MVAYIFLHHTKATSNWTSNSVITTKGYIFYTGLLYLLVKKSVDSHCIAIHSPNFLARGKPRTGWTKSLGQFMECCQENGNWVRHEEWEEKKDWDMTECEVTKLRKK